MRFKHWNSMMVGSERDLYETLFGITYMGMGYVLFLVMLMSFGLTVSTVAQSMIATKKTGLGNNYLR